MASEIIKTIKKQFPDAKDEKLREKIADNLRICFIREALGNKWQDGMTLGMHAKHFIVDDVACYIGSQNLYICDLAEWGVLIDDEAQTKQIMAEYWIPMWQHSYTKEDVDVQAVMDGLKIDRSAEKPHGFDALNVAERRRLMQAAAAQQAMRPGTASDAGLYYQDEEEQDDEEGEKKGRFASFSSLPFGRGEGEKKQVEAKTGSDLRQTM